MKIYMIGILCVIAGVFLDQYTKILAVTHLQDAPISIIDGVFELHYLENRGAAFGILQERQILFLIITCVLLIVVAFLYIRLPKVKRLLPFRICLILIAAGAIGNMIDRVTRKYVVDFLYFKLIDFPIFNVADIYVTVAAVGVIFLIMFYYKDEELDLYFRVFCRTKKKNQE